MKIEINTNSKTLKVKGNVSIGRLFEIVHEHNLDGYTLVGHPMKESKPREDVKYKSPPSRIPSHPHARDMECDYGPFFSLRPFSPIGPELPRPLPRIGSPLTSLIKEIDEEE
jgi:hypothetical protein